MWALQRRMSYLYGFVLVILVLQRVVPSAAAT